MHLNDRAIRDRYYRSELLIKPVPDDYQFQPASLDLRLGHEFVSFRSPGLIGPYEIDPEKGIPEEWLERSQSDTYTLFPSGFVLATTLEYIGLPRNVLARVEGRSSLGRLGLIIHATAGFIDPGFEGNITLEMTNLSGLPIKLRSGMRICQLAFETVEEPERYYGHPDLKSKYQGQKGVTASRIQQDQKT